LTVIIAEHLISESKL